MEASLPAILSFMLHFDSPNYLWSYSPKHVIFSYEMIKETVDFTCFLQS